MARLKQFWPYFFLFIFALVFLHKLFIPLSVFSTPGDIPYFNYPLKNFLSESLKNHQLPLWNSQIGTGFPILADGPIGTFYVPNLILFYFFPTAIAFNLSYILIFIISSFGTYLLCRSYNLSKFSSLFAALAFSYSGFFIARIIHTSFIQMVSLLPLGFWLVEKLITTKHKKYLFLFSFLVSQLVFIGYFQAVIYSLIVLFIYLIVRGFLTNQSKAYLFGNSLLFIFSVFLGLGMSAIQIFPTYELLQFSTRSFGLNLQEIFTWSGSPKILLMFLNPFFFGNLSKGTFQYSDELGFYWENIAYSGLITPFLAILAYFLAKKDRKVLIFFMLLAIFSLILALGKYGPLHVVFAFPPFSYFKIPARFLFLTSFSLSILTAFTINALANNRSIKFAKMFGIVAVTIISFDIFIHWYNFHPYTKIGQFIKTPASVQYLEQNNLNKERITSLWPYLKNPPPKIEGGWADKNEAYISAFFALDPDINLIFQTASSDFYTSLTTRRMGVLRELFALGIRKIDDATAEINNTAMNLFKLQNVGLIITSYTIKNEELIPVYRSNFTKDFTNYTIYKVKNTNPRIRMVSNSIVVNDVPDLIDRIGDTSIDFSNTLILEKPQKVGRGEMGSYKITNLVDTHNKLEFGVNSDGTGYLVVADTYYPGWKAYVDGKEREILAANLNQRAIYLEKGGHHIVFSYQPSSLKRGLIISLVSFAIFLFLLFLPEKQLKLFQGWNFKSFLF